MPVRAIPEGYHTITPAITCKDAARAIDFYTKALGAKETVRMNGPDGKVMHAEMKIGDSMIFVSDEFPNMSAAPAKSALPSTYLFLYVDDVDAAFNKAVAAGCLPSMRSEEHTSELQSHVNLVCRLLLEKKKKQTP